MDIKSITVSEIVAAFTVFSQNGRYEKMVNRPYYGISLCESGQIIYTHNGKEYVSSPKTAILLPKGESYTIRGTATGIFPVINFECSSGGFSEIAVIDITEQDSMFRDFEQLKRLIFQGGSRARTFSILYDILARLEPSGISPELLPAINYINSHYNDPRITNARLAEECCISEVYFRKLFSKQMGVSPKKYIIDMRIERARQLLSEGVMKISAVSEECGFASPYHFCRAFKQYTGSSPSEYSKNNKIQKI